MTVGENDLQGGNSFRESRPSLWGSLPLKTRREGSKPIIEMISSQSQINKS